MENSSLVFLLNFSFCVPWKEAMFFRQKGKKNHININNNNNNNNNKKKKKKKNKSINTCLAELALNNPQTQTSIQRTYYAA